MWAVFVISSFAATMASSVLNRSRCTGPMAVITAIAGGHQRQRSAISPLAYVPISATKTSVPGASCSLTARARPARLLNEAGLATTVRDPVTRWVTCCLVEVFPKEPVIATTIGATCARRVCAAVMYGVTRRRSTGTRSAHAASTTSGTAHAPRAATGAA